MVTVSSINRLSRAIDQLENWSQPRPWKVVQIPRRLSEEPDAARARHYAVHPEDRDADVVIWRFCDDEEVANKGGG